jgi:hypothetical protein
MAIYSALTDKPERKRHRDVIFSTSHYIVKLILLFYGAILDSYRENLVALDGESCSSCREPGSDGSDRGNRKFGGSGERHIKMYLKNSVVNIT